MFNRTACTMTASRTVRSARRTAGRVAVVGALAMSLATSSDAQEAADTVGRFQFVVSSGALVPTGVQRDAIARGDLTTAQLSYLVRPGVALTSSIGWSRSHDLALAGQRTLDVFTYDVGAEWRGRAWTDGDRWSLMPFAGAGAGGRSYSHRHLGTESTHNLAGYASVGGEVGYARVRLRLEARDYLTGFKALGGVGASGARNDVALLLGLRITGPVQ